MNYKLLFILPLLLLSLSSFGQIEFGLKAGLTTQSLSDYRISYANLTSYDELGLALEEADYGVQFGALLRIPLTPRMILQTEATFNSAKNTFRYEDLVDGNARREVFEVRYNDVTVPVLLSYQLIGPLRVNVGPVGHFVLPSNGDLDDRDYADRAFDTFHLGYALGGSLDLGPLTLDVRYGGNLSKYGETVTVRDATVDIDQAPKQWIGTVAYRF